MAWALILLVVTSSGHSTPIGVTTQTYATEELCQTAGKTAVSSFASGQNYHARDIRFICTRRHDR